MFDKAASLKKEMDEIISSVGVLGFYGDGVHINITIEDLLKKVNEDNLKLQVSGRHCDDFPFYFSFFYKGVRFYSMYTFEEYEKHKEEIKKVTE